MTHDDVYRERLLSDLEATRKQLIFMNFSAAPDILKRAMNLIESQHQTIVKLRRGK